MKNFNYYSPTKIYFGKDSLVNIKEELEDIGRNVLIIYADEGSKASGIYAKTHSILNSIGKNVFGASVPCGGEEITHIRNAVELGKACGVDYIIALGGTSVINASKAVAMGLKEEGDFWQKFFIEKQPVNETVPIGVVLTASGTSNHSNGSCTIYNQWQTIRIGVLNDKLIPRFSVMDPVYTYLQPEKQLVYDSMEALANLFESYFSTPDEFNVSDELSEALMRNIFCCLRALGTNKEDYAARSNLLWASSLATSGITAMGKEQDWQSHLIASGISTKYCVPNGAVLSVIYPSYMRKIYLSAPEKFCQYARNVLKLGQGSMNEEQFALSAITKTKSLLVELGAPAYLDELGVIINNPIEYAANVPISPMGYKKISSDVVADILTTCRSMESMDFPDKLQFA